MRESKERTKLTEEEMRVVENSLLFSGIKRNEIQILLVCLKSQKVSYSKGEMIFRMGEKISRTALLLKGKAHVEWYDYWGKRHIVNAILPGDILGETYAATQGIPNVNIAADEDSVLLFLDLSSLLHMCSSACPFHARLIDNLFAVLAKRNITLREKLTYITQPTLRDKILTYLSSESIRQPSAYFDIPFDRQQLADFLSSDRSALSKELSKLKKEGLIDFEKNHFHLLLKEEEKVTLTSEAKPS